MKSQEKRLAALRREAELHTAKPNKTFNSTCLWRSGSKKALNRRFPFLSLGAPIFGNIYM